MRFPFRHRGVALAPPATRDVQYWHTIEFDPAWCGKPMNNRLDACRANQIGAKIRKIRN